MAFMVITNHVAKAFSNKTSGTKMTWWKTSFNMPVRNIFDNNSTATETEWLLNATWEATSFDLSWFEAWLEVVALSTVFTLYWPYWWGNITCTQEWINAASTVTFTNSASVTFPSLLSSEWSLYNSCCNQWVAAWEIDSDQTFTVKWSASWWYWYTSNSITFSNVPNTSTTYTPWMVWVEGNNLRWSSWNWHLHTQVWTDVANPWATPWFMWIDGNYIYWIWANWHKYRWQYNFQQFASIFSWWPSPATVSWATAWMTWMDTNFWWEHIWYIASDGTKWINNAGDNPYV